jgi:hypothetical protein
VGTFNLWAVERAGIRIAARSIFYLKSNVWFGDWLEIAHWREFSLGRRLFQLPGAVSMEFKVDRDRKMHAAFEAGQSVEQLGEIHGLTQERVRAILVSERNKRTFSPEPYYRRIRQNFDS